MTDADDRLLSQEIAHVVAALRLFIMHRRLLIVCFASSLGLQATSKATNLSIGRNDRVCADLFPLPHYGR